MTVERNVTLAPMRVLDVIRELPVSGLTMLIAAHEMGFVPVRLR